MDLAKLVLEYVKVLACRVTTLAIALILRREFWLFSQEFIKWALPVVSIDFDEQILATKELATRVEATQPPANPAQTAVLPLTEANCRMISLGLKPIPRRVAPA